MPSRKRSSSGGTSATDATAQRRSSPSESATFFDRLPHLVLQNISAYLDTKDWVALQQAFPGWKAYPPRVLTLSGSSLCDGFWGMNDFPAVCPNINHITDDPVDGGPVLPKGGACAVILQAITRRHNFTARLVTINLTGQCCTVNQLCRLFSPSNAPRFPCLASAAFRLVLFHAPHPAVFARPPPNLQSLKFYIASLYGTRLMEIFSPLSQVICAVRHFAFVPPNWVRYALTEWFPDPFPNLLFLETCGFVLPKELSQMKLMFPSLQKLRCHGLGIPDELHELQGITNETQLASFKANVHGLVQLKWPFIADPSRFDLVEEASVVYPNPRFEESIEDLGKCVNITKASIICEPYAEGIDAQFELKVLPALTKCTKLVNLRLPASIFIFWSVTRNPDARVRLTNMCSRFVFQSVRRLQIGVCRQNSFYYCFEPMPQIHAAKYCDSFLASMLRMFPNVESLTITPFIFFRDKLNPETLLPRLRRLCLFYSRQLGEISPRPTRLIKWLPKCEKLDIFLFYTKNITWELERDAGGLLHSLSHNNSLRFLCVLVEKGASRGLPARSDLVRLASSWANRNWQCIFFAEREVTTNRYSYTAAFRRDSCPFAIKRGELLTYDEILNAFPELYGVFWSEINSAVNYQAGAIFESFLINPSYN